MIEPFRQELLPNERIVWTGQPDPKILFTSFDAFLIPFSLLGVAFAIFWEATALGAFGERADPFSIFWGIPFIFFILYVAFGRILYKRYRKTKTYYALTDLRAIVVTQVRRRRVQAAFLDTVPSINKTVRREGSGTIRFGSASILTSMYANTGLEGLGAPYGIDVPAFYDIPDVEGVYRLINSLRQRG